MDNVVYKGEYGLLYLPIYDVEDNFAPFFVIAGYACIFELKMRLLFDKVKLIKAGKESDLNDVMNVILGSFANDLTNDEKKYIIGCREVRNQFLHCNFENSSLKLSEYFDAEITDNVSYVEISLNSSPAELIDSTNNLIAKKGKPISQLGTYGHTMNLICGDNFNAYSISFRMGISIINRLFILLDNQMNSSVYDGDGYWYLLCKFYRETDLTKSVSERWKDSYVKIQLLLDDWQISTQKYMKETGTTITINEPK